MDAFACILLKVHTGDANTARGAIFKLDIQVSFPNDGVGELGNLITTRQVRIEIIFPIKG